MTTHGKALDNWAAIYARVLSEYEKRTDDDREFDLLDARQSLENVIHVYREDGVSRKEILKMLQNSALTQSAIESLVLLERPLP